MNRQDIPKLYYSISEVSRLAEVEQHVLRYWETEFRELAPRKNRHGKRLYREVDIQVVRVIKDLLYGERYTIEGARRRLKEQLVASQNNGAKAEADEEAAKLLSDLRHELLDLRSLLLGNQQLITKN